MKSIGLLLLIPAIVMAGDKYDPPHGHGMGGFNNRINFDPTLNVKSYSSADSYAKGGNANVTFKPGSVQGGNVNMANGAVQGGQGGQGGNGGNGYGYGYSGGNSQNVTFQGNPENQRIEYIQTPGLGTQFIPPAMNCYPAAAAQGVGPGYGASVTASFYSLPCHWINLGQVNASIGVAAVNAGMQAGNGIPANQAMVIRGYQAIEDGLDIIGGTDVNMWLMLKAKGREPVIRPDIGITDSIIGGMTHQHVIPRSYVPPAPHPIVHHNYGYIPDSKDTNKVIDPVFKEQMKK